MKKPEHLMENRQRSFIKKMLILAAVSNLTFSLLFVFMELYFLASILFLCSVIPFISYFILKDKNRIKVGIAIIVLLIGNTTYMSLVTGEKSIQLFLIPFAIIGISSVRKRIPNILLFLLSLICFLYVEYFGHLHPPLFSFPSEFQKPANLVNSIALFLVLLYLMNQFILSIQDYAKDLNKKNNQLLHANHEITDSIQYAQRIQRAIFPEETLLQKHLHNYFLIYLPKDIVAGDFYWLKKIENKLIFAVADCTGHGVPGAMVSLICINSLNRVVHSGSIEDPAQILNSSRQFVQEAFEYSEREVSDGMDIALCMIENGKLTYSGAYCDIWIFRKDRFFELKGNRQPIGEFRDAHSFTNKEIELQENDMLYLFTDGYCDQFGGDHFKKYKKAKFRELVKESVHLETSEQKLLILKRLAEWQKEHEQVDDISILGIRITTELLKN